MYQAFEPLIMGRPRLLILGTFPSPLSREKGEYYGNPQNKFWRIIFDTFGEAYSPDYDEKKRLLFQNGLALWDVIRQCDIVGALDQNIRNPVFNTALPVFIRENGIGTVLFNGQKAYAFYRRGIGDLPKNVLPSTSPAHARLTYEEKLAVWAGFLR